MKKEGAVRYRPVSFLTAISWGQRRGGNDHKLALFTLYDLISWGKDKQMIYCLLGDEGGGKYSQQIQRAASGRLGALL